MPAIVPSTTARLMPCHVVLGSESHLHGNNTTALPLTSTEDDLGKGDTDFGAVMYITAVLVFYSLGIVVMIIKYLKTERKEMEEEMALESFFKGIPSKKMEHERDAVNRVAIQAFHTLTSGAKQRVPGGAQGQTATASASKSSSKKKFYGSRDVLSPSYSGSDGSDNSDDGDDYDVVHPSLLHRERSRYLPRVSLMFRDNSHIVRGGGGGATKLAPHQQRLLQSDSKSPRDPSRCGGTSSVPPQHRSPSVHHAKCSGTKPGGSELPQRALHCDSRKQEGNQRLDNVRELDDDVSADDDGEGAELNTVTSSLPGSVDVSPHLRPRGCSASPSSSGASCAADIVERSVYLEGHRLLVPQVTEHSHTSELTDDSASSSKSGQSGRFNSVPLWVSPKLKSKNHRSSNDLDSDAKKYGTFKDGTTKVKGKDSERSSKDKEGKRAKSRPVGSVRFVDEEKSQSGGKIFKSNSPLPSRSRAKGGKFKNPKPSKDNPGKGKCFQPEKRKFVQTEKGKHFQQANPGRNPKERASGSGASLNSEQEGLPRRTRDAGAKHKSSSRPVAASQISVFGESLCDISVKGEQDGGKSARHGLLVSGCLGTNRPITGSLGNIPATVGGAASSLERVKHLSRCDIIEGIRNVAGSFKSTCIELSRSDNGNNGFGVISGSEQLNAYSDARRNTFSGGRAGTHVGDVKIADTRSSFNSDARIRVPHGNVREATQKSDVVGVKRHSDVVPEPQHSELYSSPAALDSSATLGNPNINRSTQGNPNLPSSSHSSMHSSHPTSSSDVSKESDDNTLTATDCASSDLKVQNHVILIASPGSPSPNISPKKLLVSDV